MPEYLKISPQELEGIFTAAARSLVLKGVVDQNLAAARLRHPQDRMPYDFSYELPAQLVKGVFFPEDGLAAVEGRVEFSDKHRIDDDPRNDGLLQSVYIFVRARMIDQVIFVDQTIRISQDDRVSKEFTADVDVQYTGYNGENLSMNPVDESEYEDVYLEAASRVMESRRDLLMADVEKVRDIIDYIDTHARQIS